MLWLKKVNNILTQKNLILGLVGLLFLKFLILPIFAWQSDILGELKAKKVQLSKVSSIVNSRDGDIATLSRLKSSIEDARSYFYADIDSLELDVQRDVEEIFRKRALSITQFDWISDSGGTVRSVRASVRFSGTVRQVIQVFWDLANGPKAIKQVEWYQQMASRSEEDVEIGSSFGHLVLEFYALPVNLNANDGSFAGELDID